jgi:hypothetical protein
VAKPNHETRDVLGMVLGFEPNFALEDAIGSPAYSLEASKRVTNSIPLGIALSYRLTL